MWDGECLGSDPQQRWPFDFHARLVRVNRFQGHVQVVYGLGANSIYFPGTNKSNCSFHVYSQHTVGAPDPLGRFRLVRGSDPTS